MGWSPYQYYTSSPCEFYYACKGYFDKKEDEAKLVRLQTFMITLSMGAKIKKPEDLWGLSSDKTTRGDKLIMTKELLEQIKKKHNIK